MHVPVKGTLRKAFMAVAMAGAFAGVVAPQAANATIPMTHVILYTTAVNASANAARHHRDVEAQNATIVNPSAQNIKKLIESRLVEPAEVPYIQTVIAGMKVPAGTKAQNVTGAQREQFTQGLKEHRLVGEMSATTAKQAVAKGLPENLAPYFADCRMPVKASTVTFSQAQNMEQCMDGMHWQKDTKPVLFKLGIGFGAALGLGFAGLGIAALRDKKKNPKIRYGI